MFHSSKSYQCFSKDDIWKTNDKVYSDPRGRAWMKVPSLFTSNCKIAEHLALYIKAIMRKHPNEKAQILEVGCGTAAFAYYLSFFLNKHQVNFEMTLTDMCQESIDYLKQLPQWKTQKVNWLSIDVRNKVNLSSIGEGPLFLIANYFIDSLPFVGLGQVDGQWQRATIRVDDIEKHHIDNIDQFKFDIKLEPLDINIFSEDIQKVLPDPSQFEGRTVVPTVLFEFIKQVMQQRKTIYGCFHDKGFRHVNASSYDQLFSLKTDGAIHYMFNFDILQRWIESQGGFSACFGRKSSFMNFWVLGDVPEEQENVIQDINSTFNWRDDFDMISMSNRLTDGNYENVRTIMNFVNYCPSVFLRVLTIFSDQVKANPKLKKDNYHIVTKVLERFYWHPVFENSFFQLIQVLVNLGQHDDALALHQKYQPYVESQHAANLYKGIILYSMGDYTQSRICLKQALALNRHCSESKKYLDLMV